MAKEIKKYVIEKLRNRKYHSITQYVLFNTAVLI